MSVVSSLLDWRLMKAALIVSFRALGLLFLFCVQLWMARSVGAEEFGEFWFGFSLLQIFSVFVSCGFLSAPSRFLTRYLAEARYWVSVQYIVFSYVLALCVWLTMLIVFFGLGQEVLRRYFSGLGNAIFLAIWVSFPVALLFVGNGLLRAVGRAVLSESLDRVFRFLPFLLFIFLTWFGFFRFSVKGAFVALAVGAGACVLVQASFIYRLVTGLRFGGEGRLESPRLGEWSAASFYLLLIAMGNVLVARLDVVFVGSILGADQAGVYSVVSRIAEVASLTLLAVNSVLPPRVTKLLAGSSKGEVNSELRRWAAVVTSGTLVAAFLIVLFGESVLGVFGSRFESGYSTLIVLLIGQIVNGACGSVGALVSVLGRYRIVLCAQFLGLFISVLLNAFLVPIYGLPGAAVATSFGIVAWNIFILWYLISKEGVDPSFLSVCRGSRFG